MVEIKIKVRFGVRTLYDSQVFIDLEEPVRLLKKKICDNDDNLSVDKIEVVYCGCVMEDCDPIYTYEVFNGATVHVFIQKKINNPVYPKKLSDFDLIKLGGAFRSLSLNAKYRAALNKISKPEVIHNIILTTAGLNKDPVAVTLLHHPELLLKFGNFDILKFISESHPALAEAAIQIAAAVHEEVLKSGSVAPMVDSHNVFSNNTDEDMDDLEDSSPASETGSQPISRNASFTAITADQLRLALVNVTSMQSQPSTSGASTSTGSTNTGNLMEVVGSIPTNPLLDAQLETNLETMRSMGLTDDYVNRQALQICNNLHSAIELILSGFSPQR